jgi:hypothetical protein
VAVGYTVRNQKFNQTLKQCNVVKVGLDVKLESSGNSATAAPLITFWRNYTANFVGDGGENLKYVL